MSSLVLTGTDLAAIVGALFVLIGVATTAVLSLRSSANAAATVIAGQLAGRVKDLEDKLDAMGVKHAQEIAEVRSQLTMSQRATIAAVRFIDRLVEWGRAGGRGKMPTPPHDLHEYLDPDMWATEEGSPRGR